MNAISARLQSPKALTRLVWVAAAVLVAGIIAALIVFVPNTGHPINSAVDPNTPAVDVSGVPKTVKLDQAARAVAKKFILTAVARKDLSAAYDIVGPQIRQGQSRAEWNTGNIAVIPYPVDSIDYAPMKIDYSYKDEAQVQIALLPKAGAKIKPQIFFLDLIEVGTGKDRHWVVNGWVPRSSTTLPNGSSNNGGG